MTETITGGPDPRHAFAPHPEPIEDILHRICIIFEESDGHLWASGTHLMAPNQESAEAFADRLNETLGVDKIAWSPLADRVFAADETPNRRSD